MQLDHNMGRQLMRYSAYQIKIHIAIVHGNLGKFSVNPPPSTHPAILVASARQFYINGRQTIEVGAHVYVLISERSIFLLHAISKSRH
jgi:hypothetical protein